MAAVAGVAGDPNVYYAGAASGGVWKTVDGGVNWAPIFDDQDVSSIGALAVAPSNSDIVWVGTGESWIRSHVSLGNGVYKSTDAGTSWTKMGLDSTGRIGRVVIDPTNPDIVFIAAQGASYGPHEQRGIFRTVNGGKSWQRVLFVDPNTGGIDVVMDPTNPRVLFAATWQLEMSTGEVVSGGPGSGVFKSTDGGTTWNRLKGNGLPGSDVGKIGLAIAPSDHQRIYALIETGDGVPVDGQPSDNGDLWRSDDGGASWKVVSYDRSIGCRQPYYTRGVVAPDNPDELYILCSSFLRSLDGGETNHGAGRSGGAARPISSPGGDNHDMWIDPSNADRMVVGNDLAVAISTNRGETWRRVQLPIAQLYHVAVDNRTPYFVYGNMQDGGSLRGPSNSRTGGSIARSEWHSVGGGESGWSVPDPVDTNTIWSTGSGSGMGGGVVIRYDERTRTGQNVEVFPLSTKGYAAKDVKYRFLWDAPFAISPHGPKRIYMGSQFVHESADDGRSWRIISPDLTRNDTAKMHSSGGLTPDNLGVSYTGALHAIAIGRADGGAGIIWTGSNDGLVHLTRDGGKTWTDVSANIPGIPALGSIRHIEPSRYSPASAYIVVDAHQENDRRPWVFRTHDFGKSWQKITKGIPAGPLSYAHVICEDPVRRGLLYLGTENSLYVSLDDGDNWQSLQLNLPHAPIYGLTVQEKFNDLVVATYGRGFWILDNLAPLQQLTGRVAAADVHLLPPRPAYRFVSVAGNKSAPNDATSGDNPTYGAAIDYWLGKAPSGPVTIDILDSLGQTVRTLRSRSPHAGFNRSYWDLRNETSRGPRMRTKPEFYPEFQMEKDGTRSAPGFGSITVRMPPGRYTVRLAANGKTLSQPLEILRDPNQEESARDIRAAVEALLALQTDHRRAATALQSIEYLRAQLQPLQTRQDLPSGTRTKSRPLEQQLRSLADGLIDLRLSGEGQDIVRWPERTAGQLSYLASRIAISDFAPASQQLEVQQLLHTRVNDTVSKLDSLVRTDLASLNVLLRSHGLSPVGILVDEASRDD